jgi:hypothetical protein
MWTYTYAEREILYNTYQEIDCYTYIHRVTCPVVVQNVPLHGKLEDTKRIIRNVNRMTNNKMTKRYQRNNQKRKSNDKQQWDILYTLQYRGSQNKNKTDYWFSKYNRILHNYSESITAAAAALCYRKWYHNRKWRQSRNFPALFSYHSSSTKYLIVVYHSIYVSDYSFGI